MEAILVPLLTHINVKKLRAAMSRFRCSNHILKIEMGRYDGTNEENRYCPLCTKKGLFLIENEFHLIVECEYYATLRNTSGLLNCSLPLIKVFCLILQRFYINHSGTLSTFGKLLNVLLYVLWAGGLTCNKLHAVRSKWHIQDGGQLLKKTVPFLPAIAHKSETSTATKFEMARPIFPGSVFFYF